MVEALLKAEVERLIQLGLPIPSDVRKLREQGGDHTSKEAKKQLGKDTKLLHHGGTSAKYTLRRLNRDRVRAGELSAKLM